MRLRLKLRIEKRTWLLLLMLICLIPVIDSSLIGYKTLGILIMLIAVAVALCIHKYKINIINKKVFLLTGIIIALMLIYYIIGISQCSQDVIVSYIYWAVVTFAGISINIIFSNKQKKLLFWGVYSIIIFNIIKLIVRGRSLYGLLTINEIALIATAPYSTMVMLFSGIMFLVFLRSDNMIVKALSIGSSAVAMYLIIAYLQRGIATVLGIGLILLLVIVESQLSAKKQIVLIFLSLLLLLLFVTGAYIDILSQFTRLFDSQRISDRIEAVILTIRTGDMENMGHSFLERLELIGNSLRTWFSSIGSILFGIGERRANNQIIGNHSEIIDFLAKFGLLGFSCLFAYISDQRKWLKNKLGEQNAKVVAVFIVILVIRGLVGSILTAEIAAVMWMMLPMFDYAFTNA